MTPPPAEEQEQPVLKDGSIVTTSSSSFSPTQPSSPLRSSSPISSSSPPAPECSLSARLELAASHPDMSEALVALETWCRLVGPITASKEFFECQALEILLQKLISDPALMLQSEVKEALVALFLHVFPSPSTESEATSDTNASIFVSSLEKFLQQMSQLQLLQISSTEKCCPLANRMSDSLRAVHSIFLKEQNKMQDKGSQNALESDIITRKKQMSQLHQKLLSGNDNTDIVKVECSGSNIRDILELSDVTQDLLSLQLVVRKLIISAWYDDLIVQ